MKLRLWHAVLLAVLAASGCGEDGLEDCPDSVCSNHGACSIDQQLPVCECDEGYNGLSCSSCAVGFQRTADDNCAPVESCTADFCNGNGTCVEGLTGAPCICDAGYAGADCSVCAPGFHDESGSCVLDEQCQATSCSGHGQCTVVSSKVTCDCEIGYEGDYCEVFSPELCADGDPCGPNGTCDDAGGAVNCICDTGYLGATCDLCYPGYADDGSGNCVPTQVCTTQTCLGFGSCSTTDAVTACACESAYTGAACEQCASGFHRSGNGLECVADQSCALGNPCGDNGTCDDTGGVLACVCSDGYTGTLCNNCYPGYHPDGDGDGGCSLDEVCDDEACHNGASCDDATGEIVCACAPGFEGPRCEVNVDDCVNTACGPGTCIDLVNDHVCLCPDNTHGDSCPD